MNFVVGFANLLFLGFKISKFYCLAFSFCIRGPIILLGGTKIWFY